MSQHQEGFHGMVQSRDTSETPQHHQLKVLIPNASIGSVIGKQGSSILEIKNDTSATVIVSRSNSFYPDTVGNQDRVVLLRAKSVDSVLQGLCMILEKIESDTVRLLVHNRLCGCIIGKHGVTIKSLQSERCKVLVGGPPARGLGLHERVVTCTSQDAGILINVVRNMMNKMEQEEPEVLAATMDDVVNYGDGGERKVTSHAVVESILVPEDRVGAVIGKHGNFMSGIQDLLNVNMTMSKAEQGQSICTISGATHDVVNLVQHIVTLKIDKRI